MAFMVKDGFRLYYEDTGGNGPTVLFLHGAGGNHLSWWQQVPVFAEEYRCVTVDQRGFGQSPDVAGGPGPAALADRRASRCSITSGSRAPRSSRSRWAAGRPSAPPCRRRSDSGRSSWRTRSATSRTPRSPPCASGSPPRARRGRAVLWHAALGETFRTEQPVQVVPLRADRRHECAAVRRLPRPARPAHHARRALRRHPGADALPDQRRGRPDLARAVRRWCTSTSRARASCAWSAAGHSTYFERPDVFNREVGAFLKAHRP